MDTQDTVNQYMSNRMSFMTRDSLPWCKVDVNERVYEMVDEERRFDRSEIELEGHIAELRTIAAKAPTDAKVVIEYEQDYGYDDDGFVNRKIGYWRKPTAEEIVEREETNRKIAERDALRAALAAANERDLFERLKAKFVEQK